MKQSKFKETEIGKIPEDWNVKEIGDVCHLVRDSFSPSKEDSRAYIGLEHIEQNTLRLISIGSSKNINSNKLVFRKGQILFGKLRPYFRKVYRPNFEGVCSTDIFVIDANKKFDNWFLFYFFADRRMIEEATLSSEGTRMPRASWKYLEKLQRGFPDLSEQKAIAKILSDLDSKIELNQKINKTLESIGQELFKHWFVDFEFPNDEGKPYKSSGGEMIESELGEIPRGWNVIENISEICEKINYGYTQSASEKIVGPKFLRVTDINKGDWINWNNVPYCEIDDKDLAKYILKKMDIVIARMADPGKIAIFESDMQAVFASYLIRIRFKNPLQAYYLYYLMKSRYYQNYILGASTGTVQKSLNAKGLTNGLSIVIPDEAILRKLNDVIILLREKVNTNLSENKNLSRIRDSLLPRLMSGRIRMV